MEQRRRLGLGGYWIAWLLLAGAQAYAISAREALGDSVVGIACLALQLAKLGPTLWRLYDLGRAPDDAVYTFVPLLNVGLFFQVAFSATPPDSRRAKLLATWEGQLLAIDAWGAALRRAARSAGEALLPTIALGAIGSVGVEALIEWVKASIPPANADVGGTTQGLGLFAGLLGLYTLLQIANRRKTGWSSWIPVMLFLPVTSMWALYALRGDTSQQAGVLLQGLPPLAASFTLGAVIGGLLSAVWVLAASEPSARPDGLVAGVRKVALPAVVVWGLRQQLDQIGFQVLLFVPGIYLAVSYAFSDILVVRGAAEEPFGESHRMVRGIRSRVFKVLVIWLVASLALNWVAWAPFLSATEIFSTLVGAYGTTPAWLHALASFIGVFPNWLCTLALLELYEERGRVLEARRAAQKVKEPQPGDDLPGGRPGGPDAAQV